MLVAVQQVQPAILQRIIVEYRDNQASHVKLNIQLLLA